MGASSMNSTFIKAFNIKFRVINVYTVCSAAKYANGNELQKQ